MPRIQYIERSFQAKSLDVIEKADALARTYAAQGFTLTLRQLYYQFVARAWIPNRDTEYERLGSILNDARLAGLFDWSYITDRTRNVRGGDGQMTEPESVIEPYYFSVALWEGQPERLEVWVEKDALVDIVGQAAGGLRVPYFSCRGYTSVSELWAASQRLEGYLDDGAERITILHLGDHDPSGIDMTRDITDRLGIFLDGDGYDRDQVEIHRIALNMPQVEQYNPPPNPAKLSDSRAGQYVRRFGYESWELDALEPSVLRDLIQSNIRSKLDPELWGERRKIEQHGRDTLQAVRDHYDDVIEFLDGNGWLPETAIEDEPGAVADADELEDE
jgi:hypothetical protein